MPLMISTRFASLAEYAKLGLALNRSQSFVFTVVLYFGHTTWSFLLLLTTVSNHVVGRAFCFDFFCGPKIRAILETLGPRCALTKPHTLLLSSMIESLADFPRRESRGNYRIEQEVLAFYAHSLLQHNTAIIIS